MGTARRGTVEFWKYQSQLGELERERGWDRVLPSHTFLHMGEELGEIGRLLQFLEGYRKTDKSRQELRSELAGELADLLAFVFKLANQYDVDIDRAMQDHLEAFVERYWDVEQGRQEMARYIAHQERNLEWMRGQGHL